MQLLVGPRPLIMNSRPLFASLLCASLASFAPAAAHAQLPPAGVSAVMVSMAARDVEPVVTSVLGLRSEDKEAGDRLTASLRSAFAEREMSGGQELSLEEVVLTLDCASEEDTACMTEAGRALETEKLVYGSLNKSGGSYVVDIIVLDVITGQVEAEGTLPFDLEALSAANVDATATEVVNSLYPQADSSIIASTPPEDSTREDGDPDGGRTSADRPGYVWGPYEPRPTWKKAALGISASVLIAGLVTGIVAGSLSEFHYARKFDEAKRESDSDTIASNDTGVPSAPDELAWLESEGKNPSDPCDVATLPVSFRTVGDDPAAVVNAEVATFCARGETAAKIGTIGWIGAGVGAAATIVFSVVYFVHKDKGPGTNARRQKERRFRLTGGPTQGGAMLGGFGRF